MSSTEQAVDAIRAGKLVILPTDTVYGLCADGSREAPARRLAGLKGRPEGMPIALLAADLDVILDSVPEFDGRAAALARALLPGPYTLVVPNPARRFCWLSGSRPDTIGVRVPVLQEEPRRVLAGVGAVAATSANRHGEPDPRRVDEIDPELRKAVAVMIDGGELPGTPSTVIDVTGESPLVLREGAVPLEQALDAIAAASL